MCHQNLESICETNIGRIWKVAKKVPLDVGQAVKVVDGPFQGLDGTVAEVVPQESKVGC